MNQEEYWQQVYTLREEGVDTLKVHRKMRKEARNLTAPRYKKFMSNWRAKLEEWNMPDPSHIPKDFIISEMREALALGVSEKELREDYSDLYINIFKELYRKASA